MTKKTIGIIGSNGFVGKILKQYFTDADGSDKESSNEEIAKVLSNDIIFVAVNFLDNCISEESKNQLDRYFNVVKNKIFIIKSTFVPGTLDYFQQKYPQNIFIYNPEFLTEATAWEDFTKPQFQILGCPQPALEMNNLINDIFAILPDAPIKSIISPLDAETLKHSFNSYCASKVIWFNQLYDVCKEINADYETIRNLLVKHPWIGDSHSLIFHKGYRGFGGKCLSKDPLNFSKIAKFPLLNKIIELNEELRKNL